ncbi:predicted protein [Nematostella vectensis]|uniref:RNase III domain-containing protein n=1 Tax=Nematostella vectensis TaxID=45351 RepID=A7RSG7_NEMVE|nr:predicted protein [Nematostella vectensis]|eukprot:XP_001637623.1 predicted protein [Nematostella vectensis]
MGELDDNLRPVVSLSEESDEGTESEDDGKSKGKTGTKKRRRCYNRKIPDVLKESLPTAGAAYWFYSIDIKSPETRRAPVELGTLWNMGIMLRKPLPAIRRFQLFLDSGPVIVSIKPCDSTPTPSVPGFHLRIIEAFSRCLLSRALRMPLEVLPESPMSTDGPRASSKYSIFTRPTITEYNPNPQVLKRFAVQLQGFEKRIGYEFSNKLYLIQALTHASYSQNSPKHHFFGHALLAEREGSNKKQVVASFATTTFVTLALCLANNLRCVLTRYYSLATYASGRVVSSVRKSSKPIFIKICVSFGQEFMPLWSGQTRILKFLKETALSHYRSYG